MAPFDYSLLLVRLLPEAMLVIGAMVVLFLDQSRSTAWNMTRRSLTAAVIGVGTCLVSILIVGGQSEVGTFYGGMLHFSPLSKAAKAGLLILTAGTLLIGAPERFTRHIGEYVALILMGTAGLMLLAGTEDLLTAFISLELVSLSLYLLAAFHKGNRSSAEAALKYFLFGSVAAAFTLFGISLLAGMAGTTSFAGMSEALSRQELSPLMIAGLVLTTVGLGFKLAAAPLHLWAPDAYQGAPAPSAALIASGSKLASFVLFLKFFSVAVPAQAGSASWGAGLPGWAVAVAALAATSMIVGNILALAQSNLRRLIAYSAIAHAGYVLIAMLATNADGAPSGVYYLFTYGMAVIGIFGVIGLVEQRHGELTIRELAGLSRRAPMLALCLFVFILSLAGIPPLAGFFGKFYIFVAALEASRTTAMPGLLWIVILAIGASAISLYYYLQVLKQAFVVEGGASDAIQGSFVQKAAIALLAVGVILAGCLPNSLLKRMQVHGSESPRQHQQDELRESTGKSPHVLAELK